MLYRLFVSFSLLYDMLFGNLKLLALNNLFVIEIFTGGDVVQSSDDDALKQFPGRKKG